APSAAIASKPWSANSESHLHPFHRDHSRAGSALAQGARGAVRGGIVPRLGAVEGVEFENHQTSGLPAAFEAEGRAAACHIAPTGGGDGRRCQGFVVFVLHGIGDLDIHDDVGWHAVSSGWVLRLLI